MKAFAFFLVCSLFSITAGATEIKVAVQCGAIDPVQFGTLSAPIQASEWQITDNDRPSSVCLLIPINKEVKLTINQLVYSGTFRGIPVDKPEFSKCADLNPVKAPITMYDKYDKSPGVAVTSQYGVEGSINFASSTFDVFIDKYYFSANNQLCVMTEVK